MAEKNILGSKVIDGGTYEEINVMGELTSTEDLTVDSINIMGSATFEGNLNVKTIDALGPCSINKNLKAKEINIAGTFNCLGDVEANSFNSLGIVEIKGDLNVDKASIHISPSKFNNIYGDKIEVKHYKTFSSKKINSFSIGGKKIFANDNNHICDINEIEATTIKVANCRVNRISGEDITIYDNCEIGVVEYSKRLSVSKNAKINKIVKF